MKQRIGYAILAGIVLTLASACTKKRNFQSIIGSALGTSYSIIYYDEQQRNLQPSIDSLLNVFDHSLSVYNHGSILSQVNRNEEVGVDSLFIKVFIRSKEISAMTDGAFDASGAPLFSAWHFGPTKEKQRVPSKEKIDSLRLLVGMDKFSLVGSRIIKSEPKSILNMNAIAKGYSTDVVGDFLESKGITDYLVEVGGEMKMKGVNSKGEEWKIGIDKPIDGNFLPGSDLQALLKLSNKGLATSGNYRQFFIENGVKYAHTIDPRTGYPVVQSLLSATVVADDCMTADAIATALMVMGIDKAKLFLDKHPEIDAYLIYDDGNGGFSVFYTPVMQRYIVE